MFDNIHLNTVLNSAIIYIFIIVGLRFLGKKELGQLSVADLVVIMLISEVVGDVMRASDDSLSGALIGVATIMILNKIIEWWTYKSKRLRQFLEGNPVILIRHGILNKKEMKKNKITTSDMEQVGREHGIADISKITLAILEVDGKISILKEEYIKTEEKVEE